MTRTHAVIAASLLLQASAAFAQVHEGRTIVEARLVADTLRVGPGVPFTAGVHLTIAPGWHVYWENPGDTALPIQVTWDGEPASVSPVRWPTPRKFQEQGGVTVFGYDREALLLSTVTLPASLVAGTFTLRAKVNWLVCEKVCLPGEAALALTFQTGQPGPSDDATEIERFEAQVPTSGRAVGVFVKRATARNDSDRWIITLDIEMGGGRLQAFFPRRIDEFAIEHGAITLRGDSVEFPALADEPGLTPRQISGVVVADTGNFDVSAHIAPAAGSATPAEESAVSADVGMPTPTPDVVPPVSVGAEDWLTREFSTMSASRDLSLGLVLAFAFLGGLVLNVMPCVLPVISLKILGFVHQAGSDRRKIRILGLLFAAGVLASFWLLAAAVSVVRATGEQIGWGFQFQSPGFVLAMTVVVLVFALNLFGVFEILGPTLSGAAAGGQGKAGAFVHGMLATILATPCTAPFLGTAIGFAFTQPASILFLAFSAVAAGLAGPYVLLSWYPGWLRLLPRPGPWMVRFKQAMGFLLIATLVWLLSILGAQLGPEGVVWTLAFLTCVAFAVWLVGQTPVSASRLRRVTVGAVAMAIIAAGYMWTLEFELRWRAPADGLSREETRGVEWQAFSLADLKARVERGETVFVDFTADWCWNCKVNERAVLDTTAVQERMRELNVTPVKADWTKRNPEITRLLAKFGRVGVPFYAVFPAGRLTEPIGLSEVITPASVIEALEQAGPSRLESDL